MDDTYAKCHVCFIYTQECEDEVGNGTPLLCTGLEAVSLTSSGGLPQQATHLKDEVVALHTSCAIIFFVMPIKMDIAT